MCSFRHTKKLSFFPPAKTLSDWLATLQLTCEACQGEISSIESLPVMLEWDSSMQNTFSSIMLWGFTCGLPTTSKTTGQLGSKCYTEKVTAKHFVSLTMSVMKTIRILSYGKLYLWSRLKRQEATNF